MVFLELGSETSSYLASEGSEVPTRIQAMNLPLQCGVLKIPLFTLLFLSSLTRAHEPGELAEIVTRGGN